MKTLYSSFGHFFGEEILLDGRLQTTQSTKISDQISESTAKSQFKAQVDFAASVPKAASVNAKFSRETGSSEEQSKQQVDARDTIVFEATGGNTILTTNPPKWCESVLDYRNWRVIERGGLTPIAEVISGCHCSEYSKVRQWLIQAVPVLSKFIAIPGSRSVAVRLKLGSTVLSLNQIAQTPSLQRNICHYLGHRYGKYIRPIRLGLKHVERRQERKETQVQVKEMSTEEKLSMINPIGAVLGASRVLSQGIVSSDITTTTIFY